MKTVPGKRLFVTVRIMHKTRGRVQQKSSAEQITTVSLFIKLDGM
jgi:hypothetical protein